MDEGKTYMNVKFAETGPQSPSNDGVTSTYSMLNFPKEEQLIAGPKVPPTASGPGEQPITAQTAGLNSTYSELIFRKEETCIDEDEDPPISSGHGGLSTTAQTAAQEQTSDVKIGNRPYRLIFLLGVVTAALIVTVAGLSIHISQIPQSQITCDGEAYQEMNRTHRQCRLQLHELNSTLESTMSENSHLTLSRSTCLQNLSALNSNLSDLKRMNSDLRLQFTEMETKYRSVNEAKAQICELLTGKKEQTCCQEWIRNEDECYYISKLKKSYDEAKNYCSNSESNLLEINSTAEEKLIEEALPDQRSAYWIRKCKDGKVASPVMYKKKDGDFECSECKRKGCKDVQRLFICKKSSSLRTDNPAKIRDLCQ